MGFLSRLFSKKDTTAVQMSVTTKQNNETYNPDIPPLQGDYAKTIFLWAHEKASTVRKDNEYARYFLYECGIKKPSAYHIDLIHNGYFEKAPTGEILNSFKVTELKQVLSSINQPVTGKKDALIERIIQNTDENFIQSLCHEEMYILSEIGKSFLEEHNDYVLIHKHSTWGVDWKEYDLNHREGYSFYDTVWGILNKRVIEDKQHFGRGSYLFMYQLLAEEGKRERAIEMLLKVLYIDLSGIFGIDCYKMYKSKIYTKQQLLEYFSVAIMLAPGIINPISEYKDVYTDDMVHRLYEQKLPIQICDKTLFLNIVHSVLDGTYDDALVEEKLKNAYRKFVNQL